MDTLQNSYRNDGLFCVMEISWSWGREYFFETEFFLQQSMAFSGSWKVLLILQALQWLGNHMIISMCSMGVFLWEVSSFGNKREMFPRKFISLFDLNLFYFRLCCHCPSCWKWASHPYLCKWCTPWWTGIQRRYCILFVFKTILHYLFRVQKLEGALVMLSEMFLGFCYWKFSFLKTMESM